MNIWWHGSGIICSHVVNQVLFYFFSWKESVVLISVDLYAVYCLHGVASQYITKYVVASIIQLYIIMIDECTCQLIGITHNACTILYSSQ